jgi:hypothetical protein
MFRAVASGAFSKGLSHRPGRLLRTSGTFKETTDGQL